MICQGNPNFSSWTETRIDSGGIISAVLSLRLGCATNFKFLS
jgi:hypothetical protein